MRSNSRRRKKQVTLTGEAANDGFLFRVADTGIGMTAQEAEQAMQPFRQIDSSLSRRYQGTGLGLPLTKSLVELHDGSMRIERPGAGDNGDGLAAPATRPRCR